MSDIHSVRQLHEREGWSVRRIVYEFHFSRKTVTKYLGRTDSPTAPGNGLIDDRVPAGWTRRSMQSRDQPGAIGQQPPDPS